MELHTLPDSDLPPAATRIALLLSGGVDSSVALARLVAAGRSRTTAFYLKVWLEDELDGIAECPWEEDLSYARAVCARLGVRLEVLSLQREYRERVVAYALAELERGGTPSPDLLCNREIKFGAFIDAIEGEHDMIASGHYARLRRTPEPELLLAADRRKDQTYFLSRLRADQLRRCLFPLGDLHKSEVRQLARSLCLPNQSRPDSQGLCFLGDVRYSDFVRAHLGERRGEIRDAESGRLLGEHHGHYYFTIGQRHGLGLAGGPWLVIAKDPAGNVLWVAQREVAQRRAVAAFRAQALSWIGTPPAAGEVGVKIRHGEEILPGRLTEIGRDDAAVELSEPQIGLAAGQFAVFYRGELCLGSGVIAPPASGPMGAALARRATTLDGTLSRLSSSRSPERAWSPARMNIPRLA